MRRITRFYRAVENVLAGGFLIGGLAVLFWGVVMRYVMDNPQAWIDEISRYLVIWGTLIGAVVALRDERHIQVEILYSVLPEKLKPVMDLVANALGLVFSSLFLVYGIQMVENRLQTQQLSIDVGIPLWLVYLIIPISGLMMSVRFLERIVGAIRKMAGKAPQREKDSNHAKEVV